MTGTADRQAGAVAAPFVTLTTDFGLDDPFVGLVKARILAGCPAARIVDLTHALSPYAIEAGAFWIERCSDWFPPGSFHLGIVDPGVGTSRRILAVGTGGQVFLGPDNGLLGPVAARRGAVVRWVDAAVPGRIGLSGVSATFHGRDILGPLLGLLAAGRLAFEDLGAATEAWHRPDWPDVEAGSEGVRGRVILVDRFGNCFSNITSKSLKLVEDPEPVFGGHPLPLVRTYGERPAGSLVALVNSFDVVEAACVAGSAANRLKLGPGAPVEIRRRTG